MACGKEHRRSCLFNSVVLCLVLKVLLLLVLFGILQVGRFQLARGVDNFVFTTNLLVAGYYFRRFKVFLTSQLAPTMDLFRIFVDKQYQTLDSGRAMESCLARH